MARHATIVAMADARKPHHKVRSFVAGSVLGGIVVLVAPHARKRRRQLSMPRGLAAFEGAPCFRETLEREESERLARSSQRP